MQREPTKATDRHEQLRLDVIQAMRPYDDVPAVEQLAVICVFVGQLIAMQDAKRYTPAKLMELVASNIELGNAQTITAVGLGIIKP